MQTLPTLPTVREILTASFKAAVAAADPLFVVPPHLPAPRAGGRTIVVGAGKASGAMAEAVDRVWPVDAPLEGLVLTRYHHARPARRIKIVEASHPVPDVAGERGARAMLELVRSAGPNDQLIALVSGGGSALLTLPAEGLTLDDMKETTVALLRSGAPIQDMNTVRKHLSAIVGGRLAACSQAPILALIISDVTGDDPTHIASGPFSPDPTTYADCLAIIARMAMDLPPAVIRHLQQGAAGVLAETPKPGDRLFQQVETRVIATAQRALAAGAEVIRRAGITPVILSDAITGEAQEVAKVMAAIVDQIQRFSSPWRPPVALISGGECTVTIRAHSGRDRPSGASGRSGQTGRGGRCSEFLLGLATALTRPEGVYALAADTDGIDGSEANAGAFLDPKSVLTVRSQHSDPRDFLANNDAFGFFQAAGGLVITGPTFTNVNDYRVIVVT